MTSDSKPTHTTLDDIARVAGVGRATVSKALRGTDRISPATTAKIKQIAKEMNYRPNYLARSLTLGHSPFVGVMLSRGVLPTIRSVADPIEQSLCQAGYSMVYYTSSNFTGGEEMCLERMLQNRVAGIIAVPDSSNPSLKAYLELVDLGTKLVIVYGYVEGLDVPQIYSDIYQSARLATDYLISLGHRRIAHLTIPGGSFFARERFRGYLDAMGVAEIPVDQSLIVETGFGEKQGEAAMSRLLSLKQRPTAVVARHDDVAIGAMRAILRAGLSVPNDISIVGNADVPDADMLRVPLTTIHHPAEHVALFGTQKLLDMLAGKSVDTAPEVLGVDLVVRSSCAPPAKARA